MIITETSRSRAYYPYWIDENFWVCPKHVPPIKLPKSAKACWYSVSCGSERPERPLELVVIGKPNKPTDKAKVSALEKSNSESPKRGSAQVSCGYCGATLWRRPSEVKTTKLGFFCSREHRVAFEEQARSK